MTIRDEIRTRIVSKIKEYTWDTKAINDTIKPLFDDGKLKNYRFFANKRKNEIEIWYLLPNESDDVHYYMKISLDIIEQRKNKLKRVFGDVLL
jgi:hypothetical protein